MNRWIHSAALILAAGGTLGVSACSSSSPREAFAVRDSAGIHIAESTAPAWKQGEGWRVSAKPLVDIGAIAGDPHEQFTYLAGGVMLPGGGFVVLDGPSSSLRAFSDNGTFLWEAGGKGEGPGELQRAASLALLPPDSLVVYDRGLLRVSVFSAQGEFARSFKVETSGIDAALPTPDGSLVLTTGGSTQWLPSQAKEGVAERERDPVFRVDRDGALLDTVGVFPGMEWVRTAQTIGPPPFAHRASFAVRDTSLVVGTSDDMSVEILSLDGALKGLVRLRGVDLGVTDADVAAYRKMMLAFARDAQQRAFVQQRLDAVPMPRKKAAYARIMVDGDDDLWLYDFPVGSQFPPGWSVFSAEGRYLGHVAAPDRFTALEFGSSRVLGYWTDPLGVQHVRIYAIEK